MTTVSEAYSIGLMRLLTRKPFIGSVMSSAQVRFEEDGDFLAKMDKGVVVFGKQLVTEERPELIVLHEALHRLAWISHNANCAISSLLSEWDEATGPIIEKEK